MFIRFDMIHERDRQTPHDDIDRTCIASCGNKNKTCRQLAIKLSSKVILHVTSFCADNQCLLWRNSTCTVQAFLQPTPRLSNDFTAV